MTRATDLFTTTKTLKHRSRHPLEGCPFCGGLDISFTIHNPSHGTCETCAAEGPRAPSVTKAITAWNYRGLRPTGFVPRRA